MRPTRTIYRTFFALITVSFFVIAGCNQSSLSIEQVNDFVSKYSSESNDVVTTVNTDKLEVLVNLWKNHELVDKANEQNKQQLYKDLANKIVNDVFAKRSKVEQDAITNTKVNFVYVEKQDEYGKPDFTTLVKKAQVAFTKDKDGKLTQTDLKVE